MKFRRALYATTIIAIAASPAFAQSVLGPGASNFDVLGQGSGSNYVDHPTAGVAQSTSVGNSGTLAGGAGGQGGAGGRGGRGGAGGTSTSNGNNVTVNSTAAAPAATSGQRGSGFGPGSWGAQTAVAPSYGSANPCSGIPTSGAAQGAGFFGLSFGTANFDQACRLNQARGNPIAMAYLCRDDPKVRQAAMDIGEPCPQDMVRVVYKPAPAATVNMDYLDMCFTASAGERLQHKECIGARRE